VRLLHAGLVVRRTTFLARVPDQASWRFRSLGGEHLPLHRLHEDHSTPFSRLPIRIAVHERTG